MNASYIHTMHPEANAITLRFLEPEFGEIPLDPESHGDTAMDTKKKGVITATKADFTADQWNQIQRASHGGPSFPGPFTPPRGPPPAHAARRGFPGGCTRSGRFARGERRARFERSTISKTFAGRLSQCSLWSLPTCSKWRTKAPPWGAIILSFIGEVFFTVNPEEHKDE